MPPLQDQTNPPLTPHPASPRQKAYDRLSGRCPIAASPTCRLPLAGVSASLRLCLLEDAQEKKKKEVQWAALRNEGAFPANKPSELLLLPHSYRRCWCPTRTAGAASALSSIQRRQPASFVMSAGKHALFPYVRGLLLPVALAPPGIDTGACPACSKRPPTWSRARVYAHPLRERAGNWAWARGDCSQQARLAAQRTQLTSSGANADCSSVTVVTVVTVVRHFDDLQGDFAPHRPMRAYPTPSDVIDASR